MTAAPRLALTAFAGAPTVNRVYNVDALTLLRAMPTGSVDLIAVDWPYNGVKDEAWDNQWATDADFLKWMGGHLAEMKRVLKPNGSYYGFASPRMAAHVEVLTGEYFNVLNRITWRKPPYSTKAEMFDKDMMRGYFPASEALIFADQYGGDEHASSEAGYEKQCQLLCQRIFQVSDLCVKHSISRADIGSLIVNEYKNIESATAQASNWILGKNIPNVNDFNKLKTILPIVGDYIALRTEYESLRTEYEDLRRPFTVSADVPYTDVWDFATVGTYAGKHPCEKPLDMMRHIVSASSRKGDLVLDCFCGSGNTLLAAKQLGRDYIGCDIEWSQVARNRLVTEFGGRELINSAPVDDLPLFAATA